MVKIKPKHTQWVLNVNISKSIEIGITKYLGYLYTKEGMARSGVRLREYFFLDFRRKLFTLAS